MYIGLDIGTNQEQIDLIERIRNIGIYSKY